MDQALDEVLKLDFDTVIPGHGPVRMLTTEFFWQDFHRQRGLDGLIAEMQQQR